MEKGLNLDVVSLISKNKCEDKKMSEFRKQSFLKFEEIEEPNFGPLIEIDYNNITYYKKSGSLKHDWDDVDKNHKEIFTDVGLIEAEKNYLGGVGAQIESEVIYHNMLQELVDKKVIFCDTDTALKEHPELFYKYFNTLVKYDENKFTALNGAVWSGGTFIYIPKNVKLDRPLQSYFRINSENMGQFERTIIIVDENSELHYMEGCTAPTYQTDSLHAAVVEIFVMKNAKCRYTTIQNWSSDVMNLVTKRALVMENAKMEWIDGNIGSKLNMKYPSCILKEQGAEGVTISIAVAKENQFQDTGSKMIHLAPNTKSTIIAKSIAALGGVSNYRGTVRIAPKAHNSISKIKCDTILLDRYSKSDTIPKNIVENNTAILEHEASVSRINQQQLFYLMSRGITEERAKELLILGFIDKFKQELPVEYAVELNSLLKEYF